MFSNLFTPSPEKEPSPEPTPEPSPEPSPEPTPEPSPEPTPEPSPEPSPKIKQRIKYNMHNTNNQRLLQKEKKEHDLFQSNTLPDDDYLYPNLNDPNFNIKIAKKKEFNENKYDGTIYDIESKANELCNSHFELSPHQLFVKNFMSSHTPYNSLLLFFGLGTGKTCAAIGIAEETRNYLKQINSNKRILVVASPNVRANFKLQLFDERKLRSKKVNDTNVWSIESCVGNSLLKEINPTNLNGLTKESVIKHIHAIINHYYEFIGYGKLGNYITNVINKGNSNNDKRVQNYNIQQEFNNRLIIIDEVHNIRLTDDNNNENKKTGSLLYKIAKYAKNLRFLLLSATPMFNSYKEIIWLTNLMNLNDKRGTIEWKDIFDKNGDFITGGKELLIRKLTGYVSYIRGENPYTFPFRVYPSEFKKTHTFLENTYPTTQMNGMAIDEPLKHVSVYLTQIKETQAFAYQLIVENIHKKPNENQPSFENMESFGYTILQRPLQALNMIYPNKELDAIIVSGIDAEKDYTDLINKITGKNGLSNIMNYKKTEGEDPMRYDFEYKPEILQQYGPIFSPEHLYRYSAKIAEICNCILNSTGIVLVYSQYIDGGILPLAFALEEIGFSRYNSSNNVKSLFAKPREPIDALTCKPRSDSDLNFTPAQYIMITGNKEFSPTNSSDVKYATDSANKYGEKVKVILISKTGTESIDFKNIRQIHVLEPWYNMNRIEQIIGRGVRNLSHCNLPFPERNVEIYLHATLLDTTESTDLYLYRLSLKKAIEIGKITRLMKQISVDCIVHKGQQQFTVENINTTIPIQLSSKNADGIAESIPFQIGDKPYTELCDYMDYCNNICLPDATIDTVVEDTYNTDYWKNGQTTILNKIRELFSEKSVYTREQIIHAINLKKQYPIDKIYSALTFLIENKNTEFIIDKYKRTGHLINKDNIYSFQPSEIKDESITIYDKTVPIDYKKRSFLLEIPQEIAKPVYEQKDAQTMNEQNEQKEQKTDSYPHIIETIRANIELMENEKDSHHTIKLRPDESWYKHVGRIFHQLQNVHQLQPSDIYRYIYEHTLDIMPIKQKLVLCDHLDELTDKYIYEYLVQHRLSRPIDNTFAFLLANDTKYDIYIKENMEWKIAEPGDKDSFIRTNSFKDQFIIENKKLNIIVGFMTLFKNNMVFKTKEIVNKKNNKGAYCNNAGKADIIKILNTVLSTYTYTVDTTEHITQGGLCIILEFLLRHFQRTTGRVFFLGPEQAIINSIAEYNPVKKN